MLRRTLYTTVAGLLLFSAVWSAARIVSVDLPEQGEPAKLYSSQARDDLLLTLEGAINRAQESVLVSIYSITEKHIISALQRKASQGVAVTVIYDAEVNGRLENRLGEGIKLLPRISEGLMHQKLIIIDDEEVWIGSANLTYASLRQHDNLVMGVYSPPMAQYLRAGLLGTDGKASKKLHVEPGAQATDVYILPEHSQSALKRVIFLVDQATKSVFVGMFTWTHPQLTDAVIRAHDRGLKVTAVMDGAQARGSNKKVLERMQKAGLGVRVNRGPQLLHHKFCWIDGKTLVHGSTNWTRSGFGRNGELLVVMQDLTRAQRGILQETCEVIRLESKVPQ
jgi:cardiolipin synthase